MRWLRVTAWVAYEKRIELLIANKTKEPEIDTGYLPNIPDDPHAFSP